MSQISTAATVVGGSTRTISRRLAEVELVWPDGKPHSVVSALNRQSPFLPHVRNARIVRHERRQFRVYEGGLGKGNGKDV